MVGDEVELALARNLRSLARSGRERLETMLARPDDGAELALFLAPSLEGLKARAAILERQWLQAEEANTALRRFAEAAAANQHLAPADYPAALREILETAIGRNL